MSIFSSRGFVGRNKSTIIMAFLGALAGVGACSLTIDLDGITGGQVSVGGGGGQGGVGGGEESCTSPSDCPAPSGPCEAPICIGGECGMVAQPGGMPLQDAYQLEGDCLEEVCDGAGSQIPQNDDGDELDPTDCAIHACNSGIVVTDFTQLGFECGVDRTCDGAGSCVECIVPSDCTDLPEDDDCQQRTCDNGECGQLFAPEYTEVSLQTEGNCVVTVCDGFGGTRDDSLDADLPDDGNECTTNDCSGGLPVFLPVTDGTVCGINQMSCIGGKCAGCNNNPANCPGVDTFCRERTCVSDVCDFNYLNNGLPLPNQTAQDCQREECDSQGNIITAADDLDLPADDGVECTEPACVNGSAQFPPLPLDAACTSGGLYCDGNGSCVACNAPQQCGPVADCSDATCVSNTCGDEFSPSGTPGDIQLVGDCNVLLCDGSGGTYQDVQNSDLPDDDNQCTDDVCTAGVPSNPPAAIGATCTVGGVVCDGAGTCVACVSESECLHDDYCGSGNVCVPDQGLGKSCQNGAQCKSDHCADKVCCDTECTALCYACVASKTDEPDGTCGEITPLTDPDNECTASAVCQYGNCCAAGVAVAPQSSPQGLNPAMPDCLPPPP
ncbi:MAG: hypothetical protein DRI90_00335 [Deltaproteobacteria bacterium]|nr:MAG: hypothetical protein DRI90_00335 [Deltaproteobacteria bacterium]